MLVFFFFLPFSVPSLHSSIHKCLMSGGCNYQGRVRVRTSVTVQCCKVFSKRKQWFYCLASFCMDLLKMGQKKSYLARRSGLCAQNIPDVRIHFKEWLLCKLHLNSWNQHALKPAELGSALISCCFSSLTYFIVPVLLKNHCDFTFYLFKDAAHLLFIADSVSHFSAHFIVL